MPKKRKPRGIEELGAEIQQRVVDSVENRAPKRERPPKPPPPPPRGKALVKQYLGM